MQTPPDFSALRFNADGLIPAIVQQAPGAGSGPEAGRVLMMAWMNAESLTATLASGFLHFWSRSRGTLWYKGETSGHRQELVEWKRDCDGDTLLFLVHQHGSGACHTGFESCFFQALDRQAQPETLTETPRFDPQSVYHTNP